MNSEDLYELDSDRPDLTDSVLLQALDGFVDAGAAVKILRDHVLGLSEGRVIARFDIDQLYDYRARRPFLHFDRDHWASFDAPELAVHLRYDAEGTAFLVLAGPEPDVFWERFVGAMRSIITRLGVRLTVGVNAFPMNLPHTRPTQVILHGSRPELFEGYRPWLGGIMVPASAGHLLEFRLGEAGYDALGIAAPVPPYVTDTEYPGAAAALLREISARTGLRFPTDDLDAAAAQTRLSIDEQIQQSDDLKAVVQALEEQYDTYLRGRENSLLADEGSLPSADELGAELERFLADQSRGTDPPAQPPQ
jgi:PAC2 family